MDDYAKMWLELAFPFYLILIAASLIIMSHHSTKIQRLTSQRAIPVLATLFLLSYTKILLVVSSVMFSYSTITHLPSGQTSLVWCVDANVPLCSIKFITLFVICLVIFTIQVPFSIILLFTRTLSRFHFVNNFKPLLDAYQAPYKDRYYNWTGIQLVVRVVFIGISSLDRKISLIVGSMLLGVIGYTQGFCNPLKSVTVNISELIFLFNVLTIFLFAIYGDDKLNVTPSNVMITIAALQFCIIVAYHIVVYWGVGKVVIMEKIQLSFSNIAKKFRRLKHRNNSANEFFLPLYVRNRIPDREIGYCSL